MVFACLGLFGGSGWADSANSGMFVRARSQPISASSPTNTLFPTSIPAPHYFQRTETRGAHGFASTCRETMGWALASRLRWGASAKTRRYIHCPHTHSPTPWQCHPIMPVVWRVGETGKGLLSNGIVRKRLMTFFFRQVLGHSTLNEWPGLSASNFGGAPYYSNLGSHTSYAIPNQTGNGGAYP